MNYHELQKPVENEYHRQLVAIFSSLFDVLDQLHLDANTIHQSIKRWLVTNGPRLREATVKNIHDLNQVADQTISNYRSNLPLEQQLVTANVTLIDSEIRKLQESLIVLAVQANTYGMPRAQVQARLQQIADSTIDALELLAINASILNTRELIFDNAVQHNYREYLGQTQDDDKVRDDHYEYYHNVWIALNNPPPIGHVGCQINCRCYAIEFR